MILLCSACKRSNGNPAFGAVASRNGCRGSCIHWALDLSSRIGRFRFRPEDVISAITIFVRINDIGLLVCRGLTAKIHATKNHVELQLGNPWAYLFCDSPFVSEVTLSNLFEALNSLTKRLSAPLPSIVISIHAFSELTELGAINCFLKCISMSGDVVALLNVNDIRSISEIRMIVIEAVEFSRSLRVAGDFNMYTLAEYIEFYGGKVGARKWDESIQRVARDGTAYTFQEFQNYYGKERGKIEWHAADPAMGCVNLATHDGQLLMMDNCSRKKCATVIWRCEHCKCDLKNERWAGWWKGNVWVQWCSECWREYNHWCALQHDVPMYE